MAVHSLSHGATLLSGYPDAGNCAGATSVCLVYVMLLLEVLVFAPLHASSDSSDKSS